MRFRFMLIVAIELASSVSPPTPPPPLDGAAADKLVALFLESCTPLTLIAYAADLADYARFVEAVSPAAAILSLLAGGHGPANARVLEYRSALKKRSSPRKQKLAASTINRRLVALRSCVRLARMIGLVAWAIDVPNLKVEAYRDTRGPGTDGVAKVLAQAERTRDVAIIHLLYDLALRRLEVHRLDLADVSLDDEIPTIRILGKGRSAKETLTLPVPTAAALRAWIVERGEHRGPLFVALDRGHRGARLSTSGIYMIVRALGVRAGVRARPHGIRHSAITEALDRANGNMRLVARFSRHRDVRVVERYDDARLDRGGEIAALVAASLGPAIAQPANDAASERAGEVPDAGAPQDA